MYQVSISLYTPKGALKSYQMKRCKDKDAITAFIKEIAPDYYETRDGTSGSAIRAWAVNLVNCENGWVRIGTSTKNERILVNVTNPDV